MLCILKPCWRKKCVYPYTLAWGIVTERCSALAEGVLGPPQNAGLSGNWGSHHRLGKGGREGEKDLTIVWNLTPKLPSILSKLPTFPWTMVVMQRAGSWWLTKPSNLRPWKENILLTFVLNPGVLKLVKAAQPFPFWALGTTEKTLQYGIPSSEPGTIQLTGQGTCGQRPLNLRRMQKILKSHLSISLQNWFVP